MAACDEGTQTQPVVKTPPALRAPAMLDWGVLGAVLALQRTQQARDELVQICAGSLTDLGERLGSAGTRDDREEIARVAHAIKGSALTIGAARLSGLAHELERVARGPSPAPPERVHALIASTLEACELTARELSDPTHRPQR